MTHLRTDKQAAATAARNSHAEEDQIRKLQKRMALGGSSAGSTRLRIATMASVLSGNGSGRRVAAVGDGGTTREVWADNMSLSLHFITHRLLALAAGMSHSSPICPDIALAAVIPGVTQGWVANAACANSSVATSTWQKARKKRLEFLITLLTNAKPRPKE